MGYYDNVKKERIVSGMLINLVYDNDPKTVTKERKGEALVIYNAMNNPKIYENCLPIAEYICDTYIMQAIQKTKDEVFERYPDAEQIAGHSFDDILIKYLEKMTPSGKSLRIKDWDLVFLETIKEEFSDIPDDKKQHFNDVMEYLNQTFKTNFINIGMKALHCFQKKSLKTGSDTRVFNYIKQLKKMVDNAKERNQILPLGMLEIIDNDNEVSFYNDMQDLGSQDILMGESYFKDSNFKLGADISAQLKNRYTEWYNRGYYMTLSGKVYSVPFKEEEEMQKNTLKDMTCFATIASQILPSKIKELGRLEDDKMPVLEMLVASVNDSRDMEKIKNCIKSMEAVTLRDIEDKFFENEEGQKILAECIVKRLLIARDNEDSEIFDETVKQIIDDSGFKITLSKGDCSDYCQKMTKMLSSDNKEDREAAIGEFLEYLQNNSENFDNMLKIINGTAIKTTIMNNFNAYLENDLLSGEQQNLFTNAIDILKNKDNIDEFITTARAVYKQYFELAIVDEDGRAIDDNTKEAISNKVDTMSIKDLADSGLVKGNIGCVDLNIKGAEIYYDKSLEGLESFVTGANKEGYHYIGVSMTRDVKPEKYVDISKVKEGEKCPVCGHELLVKRGIEIGNIFQLGTRYTKSMGLTVSMPDGTTINPVMGCYGIGVGRSLASIAEENCDEKGLVWPMSIAPWHIYLCPIRLDDEKVRAQAERLYKRLTAENFEVLYDDRVASAGIKLTDSELMGIPVRIVISPKTIENGNIEITIRSTGEKFFVTEENLSKKLDEIIVY